jgi:hypothetical protein
MNIKLKQEQITDDIQRANVKNKWADRITKDEVSERAKEERLLLLKI